MKRTVRLAARLGLAAATVTSVMLLFASSSPLIETFTNFRPHLLVMSLPLVVLVGLLGNRRDLAAGLLPVVILSVTTVPYWVGGPPPIPEGAATARVMQYNVLYFNTDHEAILTEIHESDADIVALHELTTDHWDVLEPALQAKYPHTYSAPVYLPGPGSNGGGKALLSRTSLDPVEVTSEYPLPPLAAVTELHGESVLVMALHPSPARTNDWLIGQRRDKMAAVVRTADNHDGPAMIITDLNIAPTSPDYGDFLGELGWDDPRKDVGIEPTFPATGWAAPLGVAIDHVLVSPDFTVHHYELGGGGGSDHHSLVATISLPADAG